VQTALDARHTGRVVGGGTTATGEATGRGVGRLVGRGVGFGAVGGAGASSLVNRNDISVPETLMAVILLVVDLIAPPW
jgi:hypothetical protein